MLSQGSDVAGSSVSSRLLEFSNTGKTSCAPEAAFSMKGEGKPFHKTLRDLFLHPNYSCPLSIFMARVQGFLLAPLAPKHWSNFGTVLCTGRRTRHPCFNPHPPLCQGAHTGKHTLQKCQGVPDNKLAPKSLGCTLIGCETLRTWSGRGGTLLPGRGWRDALSGWTDPS